MYATYVTQHATYEYDEIVQGELSLAAQGCGKSDYFCFYGAVTPKISSSQIQMEKRRGERRDDGEDQSSRKLFRSEIHAAMQIPRGRAFQRSGICIWANVGIRPYADYK
ncbi:hypothetical protein ALC53_13423 [Atta colombica]|uniref:Uncharacterized protein n=1 Tax=Atta colombica TaxID=520822 RepID=A0A195AVS7_9HYME|nr:hypothetical protein ALC53_13423 [Atta colombica]